MTVSRRWAAVGAPGDGCGDATGLGVLGVGGVLLSGQQWRASLAFLAVGMVLLAFATAGFAEAHRERAQGRPRFSRG
jgi:hypothetical protein